MAAVKLQLRSDFLFLLLHSQSDRVQHQIHCLLRTGLVSHNAVIIEIPDYRQVEFYNTAAYIHTVMLQVKWWRPWAMTRGPTAPSSWRWTLLAARTADAAAKIIGAYAGQAFCPASFCPRDRQSPGSSPPECRIFRFLPCLPNIYLTSTRFSRYNVLVNGTKDRPGDGFFFQEDRKYV